MHRELYLHRFILILASASMVAGAASKGFALSYGSAAVTKFEPSQESSSSIPALIRKEPPPLPDNAAPGKRYNLEPTSRRTGNTLKYTAENIETVTSDVVQNGSDYHIYGITGYTKSSMVWNIGNGAAPFDANIVSELTWSDLNSIRIGAGGEYTCHQYWCKNVMLIGSFYADGAWSGDVQDSDYYYDNRAGEFSRSNGDSQGSSIRGINAALGYHLGFDISNFGFSLIPSLGYSYDTQIMRMRNSVQTVSDEVYTPAVGTPLTGLDSSYRGKWSGFFGNLEARLRLLEQHELRVGGRYFYGDYIGSGHWNLRGDLAQPTSFKHIGNGATRTFNAGYSFWFTPKWEFRLDAMIALSKAGAGESIFYGSGGSTTTNRFNESKFKSRAYTVGIGYKF